MIVLESFQCTYPSSQPIKFPSVTLPLGKSTMIIGPNGSGKTTCCLAIAQLLHLTDAKTTGSVSIPNNKRVGFVLENPVDGFFQATIADEIAWGLENLGIPPAEIDDRIDEALKQVGLDYLEWHRSPSSLSGGEQKRLAIAVALAIYPDILVLDQPSFGLSHKAQKQLFQMLKKLREVRELTIIFTAHHAPAAHDMDFPVDFVDETLFLSAATTAGAAATATGTVKTWNKAQDKVQGEARSSGVWCSQTKPLLRSSKPSMALTVCETIPRRPMPEDLLNIQKQQLDRKFLALQICNVTFRFNNVLKPILEKLNLEVMQGEFVALLGENGSGKSTLARLLLKLISPEHGSLYLCGKNIASSSTAQLAHHIGYAFQNPELQIFAHTVREEIAFGPKNLGLSFSEVNTRVDEIIDEFGLQEIADSPPAVLSFSQRRLVALASIMAMRTQILVLDEPTVGLDTQNQQLIMHHICNAHRNGTTILLITHDKKLAEEYAERTLLLNNGEITDV